MSYTFYSNPHPMYEEKNNRNLQMLFYYCDGHSYKDVSIKYSLSEGQAKNIVRREMRDIAMYKHQIIRLKKDFQAELEEYKDTRMKRCEEEVLEFKKEKLKTIQNKIDLILDKLKNI